MSVHALTPVLMEARGTITNNWYTARTSDGLLLMVGPYLPAAADGVIFERVEESEVPGLLQELEARLGEAPREIILKGEFLSA